MIRNTIKIYKDQQLTKEKKHIIKAKANETHSSLKSKVQRYFINLTRSPISTIQDAEKLCYIKQKNQQWEGRGKYYHWHTVQKEEQLQNK